MNDHDAMARLAAANPVPRPVDVPSSQALFCLRTVLAQERPPKPPRRRPVLVAAAVIVFAAAGTLAVQQFRPERAPAPPRANPVAAPSAVLAQAAGAAGKSPAKGQFVHVTGAAARVVHVDSAGGYDVIRVDSVQGVQPADGRPGEGWLTIGEQGSSVRPLGPRDSAAYLRDGSPGPGKLPRSGGPGLSPNLADDARFDGEVGALPDDPAAAAAAMAGEVAGAAADHQGWLFRECTRLLDAFTGSLSGADRAKLFRTLSGVTGVRTLEAATDPLGRPAVGLAYTGETRRYGLIEWQVFLRAGSDQIGFAQAVVRRPGPANRTLTPGVVQYSVAVTGIERTDTP